MNQLELLSPAGSFDCVMAAVQNGADAVYFGAGNYNARVSAVGFAEGQLQEAIDYCHERGVRAYLTLNTLLLDRELASVLELADEL